MPKPGEVYLVDLGMAGKVRPVVIVSREDTNAPRALSITVPLTTQNRGSRYEVQMPRVPWLRHQSIANVQAMAAYEHHELLERRQGLHVPGQLALGQRRRDLKRPAEAVGRRDGGEQLIDGGDTDAGQHGRHVVGRVQGVGQTSLLGCVDTTAATRRGRPLFK